MLPSDVRLWRLSEADDRSLGVACTEEGLFLGRTALIERHRGFYEVRKQADLERLLGRAYGCGKLPLDRVMPRLTVVAAALGEQNLCLAQIAALHLRLPELPDMIARGAMEAEDRLIKAAQADETLARGSWDPAEHPRAGVPPNPGWFAPTGSPNSPPLEIAQNEEDERAPEELSDPVASVRQALWNSTIARLREIDPHNPHLSHFSNPGAVPSQEALDRLSAALETAVIKRVNDKVVPDGKPIGEPGSSAEIRVLHAGLNAAHEFFDYLRVGGSEHLTNPNTTVVKLPGNAGFLTLREVSRSRDPAIDINVPGVIVKRIHFND